MGRMTADPQITYTQGAEPMCVARFNLAVDRHIAKNADDNQQTADFISCVAFRKRAEVLEKYGRKGLKLCIEGRIQTGSYTNKDGNKVYTTDVVVENIEFCESKGASEQAEPAQAQPQGDEGFMNIPDGIDEELPFN